jgi:hypothetical protein
MKIILVFASVFITLFTSTLDAAHRESKYNAAEAQQELRERFAQWGKDGIDVGIYPAYFEKVYAEGQDGRILAIQPMDEIEVEVKRGFTQPSFHLLGQVNIKNQYIDGMVSSYTSLVSAMNSEEPNIQRLYHAPKGGFSNILLTGFDLTYAESGLLGKGIYLSPDPLKANDYSPVRGTANKLRAVFLCNTTLGKVLDFGVGRFDRDLVRAPVGYHSVKSFIRRSTEHVVYNSAMVSVTSVIFYHVTDTAWELTPPTTIPPNVSGRVFFITASLSDFLTKIQARASQKGTPVRDTVREAIGELLRGEISAEAFIGKVATALKAPAPKTLLAKLEAELEKAGITQTQPAAAAPAVENGGEIPEPAARETAEGVEYTVGGSSNASDTQPAAVPSVTQQLHTLSISRAAPAAAAPAAAHEGPLPMPADGHGVVGVDYIADGGSQAPSAPAEATEGQPSVLSYNLPVPKNLESLRKGNSEAEARGSCKRRKR